MTSVSDRYDRAAASYARYWAPVLADASRRLLDLLEADRAVDPRSPMTVLDVGTGGGALAFDVLARWQSARVVAADASSGMLESAREMAGTLEASQRERLTFAHGPADAVPVPSASVDLIISSFVYQLVPDRRSAFREALRVLRPGGQLGLVTWIAKDEEPFVAADEFDEAVYDLEIQDPEHPDEEVAGDYESARAARGELRWAGFSKVEVRELLLDYQWELESYLDYKRNYGESGLFNSLGTEAAEQLAARARERLSVLRPEAFRWRTPVVYAFGTKPPTG